MIPDIEKCKRGQHNLEVVYYNKHSLDKTEAVVRWCSTCGCVVVDLDYDGRTEPGRIVPMKTPQVMKGQ